MYKIFILLSFVNSVNYFESSMSRRFWRLLLSIRMPSLITLIMLHISLVMNINNKYTFENPEKLYSLKKNWSRTADKIYWNKWYNEGYMYFERAKQKLRCNANREGKVINLAKCIKNRVQPSSNKSLCREFFPSKLNSMNRWTTDFKRQQSN